MPSEDYYWNNMDLISTRSLIMVADIPSEVDERIYVKNRSFGDVVKR